MPTDILPSPTGDDDTRALPSCMGKRGLARFLGLSVRSLDRASAMGLLPRPDLIVGRSPRWSPDTITKWLRTHPRLPGRKGVKP
jgi:predicted DNA-binding transcriptional regulator AlpA